MACNITGHGCDIADPRVSSEIHRISDFSKWIHHPQADVFPNSKVHGANMGPIWGRQDPGGPHVGPMNFAIWVVVLQSIFHKIYTASCCVLLWFRFAGFYVIRLPIFFRVALLYRMWNQDNRIKAHLDDWKGPLMARIQHHDICHNNHVTISMVASHQEIWAHIIPAEHHSNTF